MEIKVGDEWLNIDNTHSPDLEDLFNVLERKVNSVYLAALISKGEVFTDENDETKIISYTKNEMVARVIYELFFLIAHSLRTVLELKDIGSLNLIHGVTIARSIVEASINTAYILSTGKPTAEQALAHAYAKSYHSLERGSGNGPHRMEAKQNLSFKPSKKFLEMVDDFTSAKGRPLNWTKLSVAQRIDEIQKGLGSKIAIAFNAAYINVYQDASEILHGSYLGALMSHSRSPFDNFSMDLCEMDKANESKYSYTLMSLFLSTDALLKGFCKYTELETTVFDLEEQYKIFAELMFDEPIDKIKGMKK